MNCLSTFYDNPEKEEKIIKELSDLNIELSSYFGYKKLNKFMENVNILKIFKINGIFGITGLCKLIKTNDFMVFKLSKDIDNSIEHEYDILKEINEINNPHIVRLFGKIKIPISSTFIEEPTINNFDIKEDLIPREFLFIEFINKTPFYSLCDRVINLSKKHNIDNSKYNKNVNCVISNIVFSHIFQILISLEILQYKKKFTHYDLHVGNILSQKCNVNAFMLYKLRSEYFVVPTFGFYPKIIDFGLSYSNCCENNYMTIQVNECHFGFQSSVFDKLNDVYHFLLCGFYYFENKGEIFNAVYKNIMDIFRYFPLLKKSGWSELPNNISGTIMRELKQHTSFKKDPSVSLLDKQFLELVNNLILLPLNADKETVSFKSADNLFYEFNKFLNVKILNQYEISYCIKVIISSIKESVKSGKSGIACIQDFENNVKKELRRGIDKIIDMSEVNFQVIFDNMLEFSRVLKIRYSELMRDNEEMLKKAREKTIIKSPIDVFIYFLKKYPLSYDINNDTIFYFYDSDLSTFKIITPKFTQEQIDEINNCEKINKADIISQHLKIKD